MCLMEGGTLRGRPGEPGGDSEEPEGIEPRGVKRKREVGEEG